MTTAAQCSDLSSVSDVLSALLPQRGAAEGLSSSALQEYVDRLDARKAQVLLAFYSQLGGHAAAQDGGAGSVGPAAALAAAPDAAELVDAEVAALAAEQGRLAEQLRAAHEEVAALAAEAEAQQRLAHFDGHLRAGAFSEAAWCLLELRRASEDPGASALQGALEERGSHFAQALAREVVAQFAIEGDPAGGLVRVARPGALADMWKALEIAELLPAQLQALAARLVDGLVLPVLATEGPVLVSRTAADSHAVEAALRWQLGGSMTAEDALLDCLAFLAEAACGGGQATFAALGALVWPRLASAYIERRLAGLLPAPGAKDPPAGPLPQAEGFQRAARAAQRFEQAAARTGFVPVDAEGRGRIDAYVQHALDKLLHGRRLKVVAAARRLLLAPNHETIVVGLPLRALPAAPQASEPSASFVTAGSDAAMDEGSSAGDAAGSASPPAPNPALAPGLTPAPDLAPDGGDQPLLAQGTYRVTRTAEALAGLVADALVEAACCGSPALAQTLAAAVRDAAELAGALPPATRAHDLQVPQQAALFHNDCTFLAERLLAAPYLYAPGLAAAAPSAPAQFVDAAQRLRAAGAAVLQEQVQRQCEEVASVLEGAEGFRRVNVAQRGITARKVVQQALAALRRLGAVLCDVLPPRELVDVAGAVIQALAERVVEDLLALADISMEESEDLPRILAPLADDAAAAALARAGAGAGAAPSRAQLLAALEARAPALLRLREVLAVMGARLAEIRAWWLEGRLAAAGLHAPAVAGLVRALFEDTEPRQELLAELAAV